MNWTEHIRLRTAQTGVSEIIYEMIVEFRNKRREKSKETFEIALYSNGSYQSDLLIIIQHDGGIKKQKSLCAMLLIEYLEQFGLIDYSTWLEISPTKEKLS